MAMASVADLNAAMAMLQDQINTQNTSITSQQLRIDTLERNFQTGGQHIMDSFEAKKSELTTLQQGLGSSMQTQFDGANNDLKILMEGLKAHETVLNQLPGGFAEVQAVKGRIEVVRQEIVIEVQKQLTTKDAETRKTLEERLGGGHAYLQEMEARLKGTAPAAAAAASAVAAPDPLQFTAWATGPAAVSGTGLPVPASPPGMSGAVPMPGTAPAWPAPGWGDGNGKGGSRREFYPHKKAEPGTLKSTLEWRDWRENAMEYWDDTTPGLQAVLTWIHSLEETPTLDEIVAQGNLHGVQTIREDSRRLWRALKKLTEGVAKQVVQSTKEEDGYTAWHRLAAQFEPSLVAMRGNVLADVAAMAKPRASKPLETKQRLADFQAKRKKLEDITGEDMNGTHIMSVLQSMIDETTKQHTVKDMPKVLTRDNVDRYITEMVRFINIITGGSGADDRGPAPMQVGALQLQDPANPWYTPTGGSGAQPTSPAWEDPNYWGENPESPGEDWTQEQLNAMGAKGGPCHRCGEYGHFARDGKCGLKGASKGGWQKGGKGGGGGKSGGWQKGGWQKGGKGGGGKGGKGGGGKGKGCFLCGDLNHWSRECPKAGTPGLRAFQGSDAAAAGWPVERLAAVTTRNAFEALEVSEDADESVEEVEELPVPAVPAAHTVRRSTRRQREHHRQRVRFIQQGCECCEGEHEHEDAAAPEALQTYSQEVADAEAYDNAWIMLAESSKRSRAQSCVPADEAAMPKPPDEKATAVLTQQLEDGEKDDEAPEMRSSSDDEPAEKKTVVEDSDSDEDDPNWVENLLKENGVAVSELSQFSPRRRRPMGTTTPTRWSRRVIDPDSLGKVTTRTITTRGAHTNAQSVRIPSPGKLVGKSSSTSESPERSPGTPKIPRESPEVPELGGWTDVRRQRRRRQRLEDGKQGEQAPGEGHNKKGKEGVRKEEPCGCCWHFPQ